jgi:hypothetical protein
MVKQTDTSKTNWARLLALCVAAGVGASTCPPAARAQSSDLAEEGGASIVASADEWRLDGVIVRLDRARRVFWLRPEVQVLRDEDALLDGSDAARRVSVDAGTLVWTPDGQARPFGFNALNFALRRAREVSVVGTREAGPSGVILRARLLILPDLLPDGWQPEPLNDGTAATRPILARVRAVPPKKPAALAPRPPARPKSSVVATAPKPARQQTPTPRPQRRPVRAAATPRASDARVSAPRRVSGGSLGGAVNPARASTPTAPRAVPSLSPRASAGTAGDALAARSAPASLSRAAETGEMFGPARAAGASAIQSAPNPALAPRQSAAPSPSDSWSGDPSLPSSPRVARETVAPDGEVARREALPTAGRTEEQVLGTGTRGAVLPPEVLRGAARDEARERLKSAPPLASAAAGESAWRAGEGSARPNAESVGAPLNAPLSMRSPLPAAPARVAPTAPILSAPAAADSSSRLAPVLSPRRTTPDVLAGAPESQGDAVQVLARREQDALAARENFARLREMQNVIPWPHFSGLALPLPRTSSTAGAAPVDVAHEAPSSATKMKMVALTFDDGPHPNTRRVLDIWMRTAPKAPSSSWAATYAATPTYCATLRGAATTSATTPTTTSRASGWTLTPGAARSSLATRRLRASWEAHRAGSARPVAATRTTRCKCLRRARWCAPIRATTPATGTRTTPEKSPRAFWSAWRRGKYFSFTTRCLKRCAPYRVLLRELQKRGYKCVTLSELAHTQAQNPNFAPHPQPPGQGIVLPASCEQRDASTCRTRRRPLLPADAPVLLQVAP